MQGIRAIAYDPNGIPRLFADNFDETEHDTKEIWDMIIEYIKKRPDRGPLDKWSIKMVPM
jgi:hypothetical protein